MKVLETKFVLYFTVVTLLRGKSHLGSLLATMKSKTCPWNTSLVPFVLVSHHLLDFWEDKCNLSVELNV